MVRCSDKTLACEDRKVWGSDPISRSDINILFLFAYSFFFIGHKKSQCMLDKERESYTVIIKSAAKLMFVVSYILKSISWCTHSCDSGNKWRIPCCTRLQSLWNSLLIHLLVHLFSTSSAFLWHFRACCSIRASGCFLIRSHPWPKKAVIVCHTETAAVQLA